MPLLGVTTLLPDLVLFFGIGGGPFTGVGGAGGGGDGDGDPPIVLDFLGDDRIGSGGGGDGDGGPPSVLDFKLGGDRIGSGGGGRGGGIGGATLDAPASVVLSPLLLVSLEGPLLSLSLELSPMPSGLFTKILSLENNYFQE